MSVPPSIFALPPSIPNTHTQHNLRLDPPPITHSRFASSNPFVNCTIQELLYSSN
jgi:hypothetical protein